MPQLRINATEAGLWLQGSPQCARSALMRAAKGDGPVIVMIHGFKYDPALPGHCPHARLFGTGADGWPHALGFGAGQQDEGLAVSLGWGARGPLRQAYRAAGAQGAALAGLVHLLRRAAPARPVHFIAHSLGAELALSALGLLPPGSVQRVLLLTGASYRSRATAALSSPAGRTAELFNVVSRENDLFDFLFERMVTPPCLNDRAIGQGISAPNAVNIQLDCAETLDTLARLGLPVAPPQRRVCHWSSYTRGGVMALYARLMRRPDTLPLAVLRAILPPAPAPRWSRLPLAPHGKTRNMGAVTTAGNPHEHAY